MKINEIEFINEITDCIEVYARGYDYLGKTGDPNVQAESVAFVLRNNVLSVVQETIAEFLALPQVVVPERSDTWKGTGIEGWHPADSLEEAKTGAYRKSAALCRYARHGGDKTWYAACMECANIIKEHAAKQKGKKP